MTGSKILVVEDDQDLLYFLSEQLKDAGYDVVGARDGTTAIMVAQKQKPNLILLDVALPGADGFVVMKRLKSLIPLSAIPIVAITGKYLSPDQEKTLAAKARAFLRKPLDMNELQSTIRSALGFSGAEPSTEARPTV
jgi:CheY-like chemotaxis protein